MEYESIHRETRAREFFIASSRDEEIVEYESSISLVIACHTSIIGLNTLHKVVVPLANLQRAVHLPFFSWGLKTGTVYPMQLRQY